MLYIRIITVAIMVALMSYMTFFGNSIGDLAEEKINAVILISSVNQTDSSSSSLGAGFFVVPNLIVTNAHVVADGNNIFVQAHDSSAQFTATVIAKNQTTDIALVKINDWQGYIKTNNYRVLELVSSRDLSLGDEVWSIGHPWGLYWTVSHGIVSSTQRRIDSSMMFYIQTDAAIHQGNSGGPLLNSNGDVVGIISKVFSLTRSDGYGLAIPSDIVIDNVEQLKQDGEVEWSTIGINLVQTDDGRSVEVADVLDWPSTKNADIEPGDILTEITTSETGILGVKINNIEDLLNELVITNPGEKVILTLMRDGKTVYTTVTTESVPIL